jgi:hypothetical protein
MKITNKFRSRTKSMAKLKMWNGKKEKEDLE